MGDIQTMAYKKIKEERATFFISHIIIWFIIGVVAFGILAEWKSGTFNNNSKLFIFLIVFVLTIFFCAEFSVIKSFVKIEKGFKRQTYKYYYLDIQKYSPDRYDYRVTYCLDGKQYSASTDIYGATKIHVFDFNGEHVTVVEDPNNV